MAQYTGSNSHEYKVFYFNRGFEEAQRLIIQISEQCSRSGQWPEPTPRYVWFLEKLERFRKGLISNFAPQGFKLDRLDDLLVALISGKIAGIPRDPTS